MSAEWEISDDFPDEDVFSIEILPVWTMFSDGAARSDGAGAGVVFVSPEKQVLTYSIVLTELCSNNVAEYQALIIGLQMTSEMGIIEMEVYGNSKLIINQHMKSRKKTWCPSSGRRHAYSKVSRV
ncbi:UNVERIFIED_CONTAM: hypothetical protein Sradi_3341100 [Sesamum radiatum]|uniref:RNase H type-1 domain-containing protein n=1 Tax=Sesamum radiatum TaxID=300843 RepID=A0AAW2R305_SESRA